MKYKTFKKWFNIAWYISIFLFLLLDDKMLSWQKIMAGVVLLILMQVETICDNIEKLLNRFIEEDNFENNVN